MPDLTPIPPADTRQQAAEAAARSVLEEYRVSGFGDIVAETAAAVLASSSPALPEPPAPSIDAEHLARQRAWSEQTFGPGSRTAGVVDHIRKELLEVEADPTDLGEWVDVVILALDGAWRAGHGPQAIIDAIRAKQARNEAREWPDWRTAPADKAIEHVRGLLAAADVAEEQQP